MTTTAQQTPPTPAQRLAAKIRARTDDTRDILTLLHGIAEGGHDATEHDKITATGILFDRGYGKAPKFAPDIDPDPNPDPETDDNDIGAVPESPAAAHKEPESPRLVSQLDDSLHESLGPAPSAEEAAQTPMSPDPFDDPSSIQSIIRDHIISITNDGDTLIDVLVDIAWADDPGVKPFHRNRAGKMLLERGAGTDPTPVLRTVRERPEPSQSVSHHPEYPPGYIPDPSKGCIYCSPSLDMPEGHEGEHRINHEGLAEAFAHTRRVMEEHGITPPDLSDIIEGKHSTYNNIPEDYIPNPDIVRKEAAEFWAKLELQEERRKQWPAIEERRRKKLAQMYPSHSDDMSADSDPPDP